MVLAMNQRAQILSVGFVIMILATRTTGSFWEILTFTDLSNRNRPGGNLSDTLIFNDAIGHLGLVKLPLKGRAFTWSNMQSQPLLEQLDWFFTSPN